MYLIVIAWLYVALMMAAAEALHPAGGLVGGLFTFVIYGAAPVSLFVYLFGGRFRRRAREREATQADVPTPASASPDGIVDQPDGRGHAPGDAVAPVGEEAIR